MKAATAVSSPSGTTLPRRGFFLGVQPPQYRAAVVATELADAEPDDMTQSPVLARDAQGLQVTPSSLPRCKLLLESLPQTGHSIFRFDDFGHAMVRDWKSTDSPWQDFRRTLVPLRWTAEALDEDIRDTLTPEQFPDAQAKHAGLIAVAWLVDILGLTRPTILQMGGVPSSTFYAWRNKPQAVVRTPTIGRLLRLQAQIANLNEALGGERTRAWVLSDAHFEKLQGDDAAFAQTLAEAADALSGATRIRPRSRMRRADYSASLEEDNPSTQDEGL
jgi:hypothetical protein